MAKAVRKTKSVTEIVETTNKYVLTLSPEEAETVVSVMFSVGGHPKHSPRKHADAIFDALTGAGVSVYSKTHELKIQPGSVAFNNYREFLP